MGKSNGGVMAAGVALGVGGMYLLDPRSGRGRRSKALGKLRHELLVVMRGARRTAHDFAHRTRGTVREFTRWCRPGRRAEDDVVELRVRAALGRVCSHPSLVDVFCENGRVELQGYVLAGEASRVRRALRHVPGVLQIIDHLEGRPPQSLGARSAFLVQPSGRRARRRAGLDLRQHHWAPSTRALMGALGAWLLGRGARRGGWPGLGIAAAGGALASRALTNHELPDLLGATPSRRGIEVHQAIEIRAPLEQVWRVWSRLEMFPRFMSHVRHVRRLRDGRYLWEVTGPAGASVSWRAEVTHVEPSGAIAWRTVKGRPAHAGVVHFRTTPSGRTQVDVRLTYQPPAGYLGHQVAAMLGANPRRHLRESLLQLKSLLETGRTAGGDHPATLDELLREAEEARAEFGWQVAPSDEVH